MPNNRKKFYKTHYVSQDILNYKDKKRTYRNKWEQYSSSYDNIYGTEEQFKKVQEYYNKIGTGYGSTMKAFRNITEFKEYLTKDKLIPFDKISSYWNEYLERDIMISNVSSKGYSQYEYARAGAFIDNYLSQLSNNIGMLYNEDTAIFQDLVNNLERLKKQDPVKLAQMLTMKSGKKTLGNILPSFEELYSLKGVIEGGDNIDDTLDEFSHRIKSGFKRFGVRFISGNDIYGKEIDRLERLGRKDIRQTLTKSSSEKLIKSSVKNYYKRLVEKSPNLVKTTKTGRKYIMFVKREISDEYFKYRRRKR